MIDTQGVGKEEVWKNYDNKDGNAGAGDDDREINP